MKIGLYLGEFNPECGGAYTFEKGLFDRLKQVRTTHEFYVFHHGEFEKSADKAPFHFVSLPRAERETRKKWDQIFFGIRRTPEETPTHLPASNHSLVARNHGIECLWYLSPLFEDFGVPYICTLWDLQHRLQPFFPEVSYTGWLWEERQSHYSGILRKAAYIITPNRAGMKELVKFYGIDEQRIRILPHPVPNFAIAEHKIAEEHKKPEEHKIAEKHKKPGEHKKVDDETNTPFLFYPAQFWPHKNHILVLLVLKLLKEKHGISIRAVFTGSDMGNLSYLKKKVNELGLAKQVEFRGFISQQEVIQLYLKAFALIYPSFFGPENLPPLEAFGLGCPVLASNVDGAKEQLGESALLMDPRKEEEWAEAVKKLIENPNVRTQLIQKGRVRANQWTNKDYIESVFEIFSEFEQFRRCWSSEEIYTHP